MRIAKLAVLWLPLICVSGKSRALTKDAEGMPGEESVAKPVEWREEKRCGVNCLYVLLRMMGVSVTYERLCEETSVGEGGTSMAELVRVANAHEVGLMAMQGSRASLKQLPLPAIIHQQSQEDFTGHYVLLIGRTEESYIVLDCTSGSMGPLSEGEFLTRWSGYVVARKEPTQLVSIQAVSYVWLGAGVGVLGFGLWQWCRHRRTRLAVNRQGEGSNSAGEA